MDPAKRDRIAALLAEGMPQAEIVRTTGIPQATVCRYVADIAAGIVPQTQRERWQDYYQRARREGNLYEQRVAMEKLDELNHNEQQATATKPELPPGQLEPALVAAISEHFLGQSPSSARGLPPPMEDAELLDTLAQRHADNERILALLARVKSLVLGISLSPEQEAVATAYESEASDGPESTLGIHSDDGKTKTGE